MLDNYTKVKKALSLAYRTRLHPTSPYIPLFVAETGLGKTTMIYDAMKDIFGDNHHVVYINLASITPTDFGGFPLIDRDNKKVDRIPLDEFILLTSADKPTLFFLDEWNRFKDIGILQVLFNILRRRIGSRKMSDYVFFCAAENPKDTDEKVYFVVDRDAALYARVAEIVLTKDRVSFFRYLWQKDYDKNLLTAFLSMIRNEKSLFEEFSNRELENVLVVMSQYPKEEWFNKDSEVYFFVSTVTSELLASMLYKYITKTALSVDVILNGEITQEFIDEVFLTQYNAFYISLSLIEIVDEELKGGTMDERRFANFHEFVKIIKKRNMDILVSLYELVTKHPDKKFNSRIVDVFRKECSDDQLISYKGFDYVVDILSDMKTGGKNV